MAQRIGRARDCIYPKLESIMRDSGYTRMYIADQIGIDCHTVGDKISGRSELKLWEAIAIKKAIKSDMPLEMIFERKENYGFLPGEML